MSKKCARLWREAHFDNKMHKTHRFGPLFGSWDIEKVHVARSIFRSQKCKKLRGTEHSWTFRCRFAWQAQGIAHSVKSEQNVKVLWQLQLQPTLHCIPLQLQLQLALHYITLHYTNHTTNYNYSYSYNDNYTTLHYSTLHYYTTLITLHYTTPHALHYTIQHTTLHYPTLHYATLITPPQMQLQLH